MDPPGCAFIIVSRAAEPSEESLEVRSARWISDVEEVRAEEASNTSATGNTLKTDDVDLVRCDSSEMLEPSC
jgi:hypothetical protein